MNKKALFFVFLFLSFATAEILIVAGDENFPPFEWVDEDGRYKGFNVDIMNALADEMNVSIEFRPMEWSDAKEALLNGSVDIIQGMAYSEERARYYDFTEPITQTTRRIFIRSSSRAHIHSLDDLRGHTVVVQRGDYSHEILKEFGGMTLILVPDQRKGIDLVDRGDAFAFVGNEKVGLYNIRKYGYDVVAVGERVGPTANYCIAVRKGNKKLLDRLNEAIHGIKEDGTYNRIYDDWFGERQEFPIQNILGVLIFVIVIITAGFGISTVWGMQLRKRVDEKTSELRDAYRNVEREKKRLEVFLNTSPDPILIFDENRRILFINEAFLEATGYKRNELLGRRFTDFLTKESANKLLEKMKGRIRGEYVAPYDIVIKKKEGTTFIGEMNASPLYEKGRFAGELAIIRDVTNIRKMQDELLSYQRELERKVAERTKKLGDAETALLSMIADLNRANKRLRELDRMKAEFMNITAHELKSPLTPIKMQAELWLEGAYGKINKEQKGSFEMILRNTERLMRLVDDFLTISKLESRRLRFEKKPVNITKLLSDMASSWNAVAMKRKLKFIMKIPKRSLYVMGDDFRLRQVFSNLLDNAMKFTPEGGSVLLEARRKNRNVIISVSDTGIGISESAKQHIFEKFFQADQTVKRKYGGTGLGLAICKGIVEHHKGHIWFESEEGKGTTFYVMLPLIKGRVKKSG